jgi:Protein of unknown function (DUF2804).
MPVTGNIKFGDFAYEFKPDSSFSLIDWGRGILPYRHKWWWGNGSTVIDGSRFGFNIGEFGDTSNATENCLFYNGSIHKLGDVVVKRTGGWLDPIHYASDGRFEMTMTPVFDNFTEINMLVAHNRCHQIHGKFDGIAVLDGGETIEVKDMVAFTEFAENRW